VEARHRYSGSKKDMRQYRCKFCGKSDKEVIKALKEGKEDVDKEKRILERLKQQGILKDEITTKF